MTDEQWIEFVRDIGGSLDERVDLIGDLLAYCKADTFTVEQWLTLTNIHQLLMEEQTRRRVHKIVQETPFSEGASA